MPDVTTEAKSWGITALPASANLRILFIPNAPAVGPDRLYPLDRAIYDVPADGKVTANLVQTTNLLGDHWYTVRFEWFEGGILRWSELSGKLRVPAEGGDLKTLLETPNVSGFFYGFGPPPEWLRGVTYIDTSGPKLGIYMPQGALIT